MRVLLTTDTVGGVWTYTKELTQGLLARDCSVCLVSFGRMPDEAQEAWIEVIEKHAGQQFAFESCPAPLEWEQDNRSAYDGGAPVLLRLAEQFGADLLHTNQFCFGCLPVTIPRLVVAHSDVLSWAETCHPEGLAPSLWLDRYRQLVQRGLRDAHAVVAPTRWMLAALERNYAVRAPKQVILNGRTLVTTASPAARKLQAVTAGRLWDPAKNLQILREVRSPLPVLVAGETSDEETGVHDPGQGVQLVGRLTEGELLALFAESSIYLATSIYEPFGLAPLEAALCGCAVVGNDLASFREVWGDAALYFRGPSELQALLAHLVADPGSLAEAQRRSLRRAEQLSAERMTEAYLRLYRELLRAHEPAHRMRGEVAAYAS